MFCANVRDAVLSFARIITLAFTLYNASELLVFGFLFYHVATNIIGAMMLSVSLSIVAGTSLMLGRGFRIIFVYDERSSLEVRI